MVKGCRVDRKFPESLHVMTRYYECDVDNNKNERESNLDSAITRQNTLFSDNRFLDFNTMNLCYR